MKRINSTLALVLALATLAFAQPATVGTLDLTVANPALGSLTGHAAATVSWWRIIHPGDYLDVDVCDSTFDTELGLYDAGGDRLGNDDDFCGIQSSVAGGSLGGGTYYAAVSGFNTIFNPTEFDVIGGASSGDINISAMATTPTLPSTLATFDLTVTPIGAHVANADEGSVLWYAIIHPGGDVTVSTVDALTTLPDTEVGLYDTGGAFLGSNDDTVGSLSQLTLNLAAGTYYAAAGGFDVAFSEPFDVTSNDPNLGDIKLTASLESESIGDFNGDGSWNCTDIDALVVAIASGSTDLSFDMNGDGVLTSADITDAGAGWLAVAGAINSTATGGNTFLVGDANLNGNVDGADFLIWNNNKSTDVAGWCEADFTADGNVDNSDYLAWNNNKFMSSDQGASSVPEPAALGMLLFALLVCGVNRDGKAMSSTPATIWMLMSAIPRCCCGDSKGSERLRRREKGSGKAPG